MIRRLAVPFALAAVTACSTPLSSGPPTVTTTAPTTTTIPGAATPAQTKASDLRAQLTYLLVEHAYLVGRAATEVPAPAAAAEPGTPATPVPGGATPPPATVAPPPVPVTEPASVAPATATPGAAPPPGGATIAPPAGAAPLDGSSRDISDLLSQAQGYGPEFGAQFLPLWTGRAGEFRSYAVAKRRGDAAAATAATVALSAAATEIATLVHGVNRFVAITTVSNPGTGLADELAPDDQALLAFIDAAVAGDPAAVADQVAAAAKMSHTAEVLAAAAAKLDPGQYPGTATGAAANLRATLTAALVDHVELAALDMARIASGGPDGPEAQALVKNAQALQNVVAVVYGDQAGSVFFGLWSASVGHLAAYAKAAGGGQSADAARALDADAASLGGLFAKLNPKVRADEVTGDVRGPITGLKAVADAAAAGHGGEVTALRVAAASVPKLASDLAEAIAEQRPTIYLP